VARMARRLGLPLDALTHADLSDIVAGLAEQHERVPVDASSHLRQLLQLAW
jgi:hypothetical protein